MRDGVTSEGYRVDDLHELGFLESKLAVPLARKMVEEDILVPLAALGIILPEGERAGLSA